MKLLLLALILQVAFPSELPKSLLNVNSLHLSFKQEMEVPISEENVSLYKGEIFYKKGLKFLWKYTWGSNAEVISDGNLTEVIINGKCQISPTKEAISSFPLLEIVEFPNELNQKFKIKKHKKGKWEVLTLIPKNKNSFVEEVTVLFNNGKPKEVKVTQSDGTKQTYLIEKFEKNVKIPGSTFKLKKCD